GTGHPPGRGRQPAGTGPSGPSSDETGTHRARERYESTMPERDRLGPDAPRASSTGPGTLAPMSRRPAASVAIAMAVVLAACGTGGDPTPCAANTPGRLAAPGTAGTPTAGASTTPGVSPSASASPSASPSASVSAQPSSATPSGTPG